MTGFSIDIDHNEYLSEGDTIVDAIVTVTSAGNGSGTVTADAADFAQVIMVDCSGSMTGSRIAEAKRATIAAIESLDEGCRFAIVKGTDEAQMVYPDDETTAVVKSSTRSAAVKRVQILRAGGGTAMGTWLAKTSRILSGTDAAVKYGLLLTDGRNQHETEEELREHLDDCEGVFTCDACGIGEDWSATEVRHIADTLLGEANGLPEPREWVERFTQLTNGARAKTLADVNLRVFTPARNRIRFVKQMSPHISDLTSRRRELDDKTGDYPTGSWGAEAREFHISVEVPPIQVGDDRLAARVSAMSGDTELIRHMVTARWTGDQMLSTRINPKVALHTGQAELARAIQEGVAAARSGDTDTATDRLGRAVALAAEAGNDNTARLLAKVVEVDPDTGTVQMKSAVSSVDLEMADVESVKTVTVRKSSK
ncbi:VWA domain-containing protein [Stackebrandtia nassauensis]|uniref:von Willebrand factor type A n=1 Tax=Stackebrandtia nassauensis (strain DSM 44728 / CIP 108903 / NRRL B-16338 / NBRC 102104 / LLR-40K-21) TaxID=446470 RepID=D3Q6F8_STANL|nr:VWA domain-containing protein [Stackebrandtia nassauensis]ADD44201.1 von Willebrand factor type A [Stackebrandtia nassauensis DSM 44728]